MTQRPRPAAGAAAAARHRRHPDARRAGPRAQRAVSVAVPDRRGRGRGAAAARRRHATARRSSGSAAGGALGIVLVADRLAALMLLVSSVVTLAVLLYSLGQGITADDEREAPVSIYHPTFLILVGRRLQRLPRRRPVQPLRQLRDPARRQLRAAHPRRHRGADAGRHDLRRRQRGRPRCSSWSRSASTYAAAGTLNLAQISPAPRRRCPTSVEPDAAAAAAASPSPSRRPSSRCRCGCPTATRPPRPRSPRSSPACSPRSASTRSSAPRPCSSPTARSSDLLMVAALLTMVVGILGAIAQSDLKRLLSFTLVSHIGYMIFGIGAGHRGRACRGAVFYVVHHITIQTALFLVVGPDRAPGRQHGPAPARRPGPAAPRCSACCSSCPAMNLAGIPPLSGFLGKVGPAPGRPRPTAAPLALGARRRRHRSPACSRSTPSPRPGRWPSGARPSRRTRSRGCSPTPSEDGVPERRRPCTTSAPVVRTAATCTAAARPSARPTTTRPSGWPTTTPPTATCTSCSQAAALPTRLPALMVLPTAGLVAFSLALTGAGRPALRLHRPRRRRPAQPHALPHRRARRRPTGEPAHAAPPATAACARRGTAPCSGRWCCG